MPYTLILHVQNTELMVGDVDELPAVSDTMVKVSNPRRLDGKDLLNLAENTISIYIPIERLNFIEVLSGEEDEQIIGFVRE